MYFNNKSYGSFMDVAHAARIELLIPCLIKKILKGMRERDPVKYAAWKQWCMEEGRLSDIFGTLDDPIDIDESKL